MLNQAAAMPAAVVTGADRAGAWTSESVSQKYNLMHRAPQGKPTRPSPLRRTRQRPRVDRECLRGMDAQHLRHRRFRGRPEQRRNPGAPPARGMSCAEGRPPTARTSSRMAHRAHVSRACLVSFGRRCGTARERQRQAHDRPAAGRRDEFELAPDQLRALAHA
jgi:hypothetical protein